MLHGARRAAAMALALAMTGCGSTGDDTAVSAPGPDRVAASSFEEAQQRGEARVTVIYVPAVGFAYRDDQGALTGVTVELVRDFARDIERRHGIAVEVDWVEEPEWRTFYARVRTSRGGVFGIGNVTITEARRDELDFSPPYLRNVAVLVTNAREPELVAMEQIGDAFAHLTALPYPGTLHEARLHRIRDAHFPGMPLQPVASNDELVDRLASDGAYFGYIDGYNYWRAIGAGRPLRRHPVGDDGSEEFGVILPHGSDWTPAIASFFEADGGYVRSPRYRDLLRLHLGEDLARLLE